MEHMRICIPAFALIIFVLASSCEDVGISDDNSAATAYSYTAFDARGNTIARGTLWLDFDSAAVSGKWRFDDGRSGELEGWLSHDTLALNLNPRFVDNNLFLNGTVAGTAYRGRWAQVGVPGVMAEGTFSAIRE